jgi:hypothetical protein
MLLGAMMANAFAQPIDIVWSECTTAAGGTIDRSFACDTNSVNQSHDLVASFIAPQGIDHFVGCTSDIQVWTRGKDIPDWWALEEAGCRAGAVASVDPGGSGFVGCSDPYSLSIGNVGYVGYDRPYEGYSSRARIIAEFARSNPAALTPGTRYFANIIRISNTKTSGPDACAGCSIPMCFLLHRVWLGDSVDGFIPLSAPGFLPHVTWQGAASHECFRVSARRETWGSVKSLYR